MTPQQRKAIEILNVLRSEDQVISEDDYFFLMSFIIDQPTEVTRAPIPPIQPIDLSRIPLKDEADEEPEFGLSEHLNITEHCKQMLQKALDRNGGDRKKAAQELGISERTLYRRLKQYGVE